MSNRIIQVFKVATRLILACLSFTSIRKSKRTSAYSTFAQITEDNPVSQSTMSREIAPDDDNGNPPPPPRDIKNR